MDPRPSAAARACRPCTETERSVSAVTVAVAVIAAIILIYYLTGWLGHRPRDKFVSQRAQEIYRSSREIFERTGGNATFSEYKTAVPGAEAVLYTDARSLWKRGELSPERLQEML